MALSRMTTKKHKVPSKFKCKYGIRRMHHNAYFREGSWLIGWYWRSKWPLDPLARVALKSNIRMYLRKVWKYPCATLERDMEGYPMKKHYG